jgi:SAM-dependent methyltransferase
MDYYEANAVEYNASTVDIDPSSFLEPLLLLLPTWAAILDVGCGSGRDLRWFKERGFRPMGLERSPSLAELARNHSGSPVMEADFETLDFSDCPVDALVLVGALVHIPHNRFEQVLDHLVNELSSLQGQENCYDDHSRIQVRKQSGGQAAEGILRQFQGAGDFPPRGRNCAPGAGRWAVACIRTVDGSSL